jgi:diguanylate cyclase (GGDEF)-like protein/PAS domain S-box-containing protein
MGIELRVLVVEDSEDDTTLLLRHLRKGGYDPVFQRVETRDELLEALNNHEWDIILSDYNLPGFSGLQALEMTRQQGLDIPFLVVSGAIGEETAVEMMRAGAHDYLMKNNLARLGPVVTRELSETKIRRERNQAALDLRESEEKYRSIFSNDYFALCVLSVDTFQFSDVNEGFCKLYGYSREAFLSGMTLRQLLEKPEDEAQLSARLNDKSILIPIQHHKKKDGTVFPVEITAGPLVIKEKRYLTAIVQDIMARVQTEDKLRYLSTHDALTGLYNRNFFEAEIERLEGSRLFPISIIMSDVDSLKIVNDTLGHAAGDALLRNVADVLLNAFRAEDVVARIGGDEFAILLPDMDESAANQALERVKMMITDYNSDHTSFPLELSIGVSTGCHNERIKDLARIADDRMYQDKAARKKGRTTLIR